MIEINDVNVFSFSGYRAYLQARMGGRGTRSGAQTRLAHFLKVHTTHVSQVLRGLADFSPEHGEEINEYLEHSSDEAEFFRLLLGRERASTKKLKEVFQKKIETML